MFITYFICLSLSINSIRHAKASNRLIFIPSCSPSSQSIAIIPKHRYYFYSRSLSLSSSSFFSLNDLAFCEHQQQTTSSSNGFSLLYSQPHLFSRIIDIEHSTMPMKTTTTVILDRDDNVYNQLFNQTTTTTPSTNQPTDSIHANHIFLLALLIGCLASGLILIMFIYLIIKVCSRDEGTYKIDESQNHPIKLQVKDHPTKTSMLTTNQRKVDNTKEWYV